MDKSASVHAFSGNTTTSNDHLPGIVNTSFPLTAPEPQMGKQLGAPGFAKAPSLTELIERDKIRTERALALLSRQADDAHAVRNALLEKTILGEVNEVLRSAYMSAYQGERLTASQGLTLLESGDLLTLGGLASRTKARFHGDGFATYLLDRNINYTNICRIGCDFCAFYRKDNAADAYVLKDEVIYQKIAETISRGGTGVLMQGGVNPHLKIEYYENLFRGIKARFKIHLHALSVIEIEGIAKVSRLSLDETLTRLKDAGLDSIPGAGAEILVDEIRLNQSPVKRHSHRWIDVMKAAHRQDLPTTATMMFGALEEKKHVIEHIMRIRDAQDETHGFYSFIMWTFQGENTELLRENPDLKPTSAADYLKVLAVSRLMMDNIPNIQGSWVTMGPKVGQVALHFGANDMGSIMMEENVVSAAGTSHSMDEKTMIDLIHHSGFTAVQRDTYYNHLKSI